MLRTRCFKFAMICRSKLIEKLERSKT